LHFAFFASALLPPLKKMQSANGFNFLIRLQILTSRLHSSTAGLRQQYCGQKIIDKFVDRFVPKNDKIRN